jgi:valyl-tRNA synthetase
MRQADLVVKEEAYTLNVPRTQRGGEIVEPMVSTQWFVKIQPLAEKALEAVRDGRIRIVPERFTKVYYNWLENIQDWCISRQLWWGHRIPVWYCADCGKMTVTREDPEACLHCGSRHIAQDADVLDTWFSSGLWPFSTLGWPDQTPDLAYFYPTSMMETAYDILFFWVARMIMMGLEFTGEVPFNTVYLHGLIRDEHGRKMSKSYNNAIDPLITMDELGTDALRFTLLVGSSPGNDMNLDVKRVEANRNFANKIWNAGRFVIGCLGQVKEQEAPKPEWTLADGWIVARMQGLIRDVERLFQNYQYGEAGRQLYEFFWSEFADWYLEIAKNQMMASVEQAYTTASTLIFVLDKSLRMLHPFMPFITEELWGHLRQAVLDSPLASEAADWPEALIVASWPEPRTEEDWQAKRVVDFTLVQEIVRAIRNLRAEKNVPPSKLLPATIAAGEQMRLIQAQMPIIATLAQLDPGKFMVCDGLAEKPAGNVAMVVGAVEIYMPLSGLVDLDEERSRLNKNLAEVEGQITRLEKLLSSPFGEKAPADVVQKEREKLSVFRETALKLKAQLEGLG